MKKIYTGYVVLIVAGIVFLFVGIPILFETFYNYFKQDKNLAINDIIDEGIEI